MKKTILAIDPGTYESGWIIIDQDYNIKDFGVSYNHELLKWWNIFAKIDEIVIEMFAAYGMPVGKTSFDTVIFTGMFYRKCKAIEIKTELMTRRSVKLNMCGSVRAKDANVNQAVKDKYQPYGGGKDPHKGIKSNPGPLYGVTGHVFAALALGISYLEGAEIYELSKES